MMPTITLELRREGADDEPSRDRFDDVVECLLHATIRHRESVTLGVGRVGDEKRFLSAPSEPQVFTSRSLGTPSSCSSFKSPEMTTLPYLLSSEMPIESGIEWGYLEEFHFRIADGHLLTYLDGVHYRLGDVRVLLVAFLNTLLR